jgi:hypothetical protein
MHRSPLLSLTWTAVACGVGLTLAACEQRPQPTSPEAPSHSVHASAGNASVVSGDVERQIARLRAVTAPFHDFQTAVDAGWGTQITNCFSDPQGGMGYHYGNTALIDGVVDALKPELLLYEPQKNGKLRFVAVEYIVPFTAWTSAAPPRLYGQSFHRNEAFGLWVLHVWHFRNNPRGMFADWNPRVTCDYAAP